ncbi:hypothetical protein CA13_66670 [Planctomycetes bacterium CA13]|uniref:Uncharacterized protein n=1 Tax=Novipirellula herctigrandis TaxID=2527986 RepID=A0A5C5YMS8_9BACT|nr:hypothetical protein CA13_66670 [Planctomycetes bacterium CA13]
MSENSSKSKAVRQLKWMAPSCSCAFLLQLLLAPLLDTNCQTCLEKWLHWSSEDGLQNAREKLDLAIWKNENGGWTAVPIDVSPNLLRTLTPNVHFADGEPAIKFPSRISLLDGRVESIDDWD